MKRLIKSFSALKRQEKVAEPNLINRNAPVELPTDNTLEVLYGQTKCDRELQGICLGVTGDDYHILVAEQDKCCNMCAFAN